MREETYATLSGRLDELRRNFGVIGKISFRDAEGKMIVERLRTEMRALSDALVGDDPRVHRSIRWLSAAYAEGDLALLDEIGRPLLCLSGNSAWVLVDVAIGDDYGALDFYARYAIWRHTGALYQVQSDESVADDPIYDPSGTFGPNRLEEHRLARR